MTRLIDADELKKKAHWMESLDGQGIPFDVLAVSVSSIDLAPTVEAEPVRHGKWVNKNWNWYCSECDKPGYKGHIPAEPDLDYCPNCGAKMDGE